MTLDNTPGPEDPSPSPSGGTGDAPSGSHLTLPASRKNPAPGGRVVVKLSSVAKRAAPVAPGENGPATDSGFAPLPGTVRSAALPAKDTAASTQKRLAPPLGRASEVKLPPKTGALPKLTTVARLPADSEKAEEDHEPPPLPGQRPRREKKKSRFSFNLKSLLPSTTRARPPGRPASGKAPAPLAKVGDSRQSLDDYQRTQVPPPAGAAAPASVDSPAPAAKEPVLNAPPMDAARHSPAVALAPPLADNAVPPLIEKHRLPPPLSESRREEARKEDAPAALAPSNVAAEPAPLVPAVKADAAPRELPASDPAAAHQPPPLPPPVVPALAEAAVPLVAAALVAHEVAPPKVEEPAHPVEVEQKPHAEELSPPPVPPPVAEAAPPPLEEFKPLPAFPPETEVAPVATAPVEEAPAPATEPVTENAPVVPAEEPSPASAAETSFLAEPPPEGAPGLQVKEPAVPVPAMRLGPPRRKLKRPSEWVKKPEDKALPSAETPEPVAPAAFAPLPSVGPAPAIVPVVPAFASTTLPARAAMAPPREIGAPLPPVKGAGLPPAAAAAVGTGAAAAAAKAPTVRTARARKRRLVGTIIFWVIFLGGILPALYFAGIRSGSETRVEGQVIPPPGTTLNNEVWIVTDFRDQAFSVADDLASERAPKLQEIQERQDHVQRAQADIAAREERIRLLQEQVQAAKDQIDSVIKGAHDAAQKVWDGPGADLESDYQNRLNDLRDRIAARARSLHLTYEPDKTYNSPEVWANAYRLALYQTPPGVDNVKEHQWIEDQLKAWRDYTKSVDDKQQQLRQQAAQIQLSPTPKITELNGQVEDLQHRIDSTQSEEDPIKMELQQAQADLLQSQSAEAGLDAKYYQQLYALPEQNITKRLPVASNGRFTWSEMERDSAFAEGENVHDYWIFARAVRADGRQYWALSRFSITRNTTLPLVIEPDAFISTKSILRPDLPADEQQQ